MCLIVTSVTSEYILGAEDLCNLRLVSQRIRDTTLEGFSDRKCPCGEKLKRNHQPGCKALPTGFVLLYVELVSIESYPKSSRWCCKASIEA
jgi:hypothetical protein